MESTSNSDSVFIPMDETNKETDVERNHHNGQTIVFKFLLAFNVLLVLITLAMVAWAYCSLNVDRWDGEKSKMVKLHHNTSSDVPSSMNTLGNYISVNDSDTNSGCLCMFSPEVINKVI